MLRLNGVGSGPGPKEAGDGEQQPHSGCCYWRDTSLLRTLLKGLSFIKSEFLLHWQKISQDKEGLTNNNFITRLFDAEIKHCLM